MRKSFLIIQTAFTGDAILATALVEKLREANPENTIDILVRKGNDSLFDNHPFIKQILIWDKKNKKYRNLLALLSKIRSNKYNVVINLQRFAATGLLTAFSGAKETRGFDKNPFSFLFTKRIKHSVGKGMHEVERNNLLISDLGIKGKILPRLYPSEQDFKTVESYKQKTFITISPASVWATKTLPYYKWIELINLYQKMNPEVQIFLLGSQGEHSIAENIRIKAGEKNITNLCGSLSLLQSAALMKSASMNYVNDSAPMHLASAMNAPVTVVYCSTIPGFGFGPLSEKSRVIETKLTLSCRPCGLHGYKECPLVHFKCAHSIETKEIFA